MVCASRTLALLAFAATLAAGADARAQAGGGRFVVKRARPVAGGLHWRLTGRRGVVHVWQPANYRASRAGVVFYQHGYTSRADRAWALHRLPVQFAASGRQALFIVPDGPRAPRRPVRWTRPEVLLGAVCRALSLAEPAGPRVVVAHSGGFRSAAHWIGDAKVTDLLLLDASYGRYRRFKRWLVADPGRRMTLVSRLTRRATERWLPQLPGVRRRQRIPRALDRADGQARVLYLRSQYSHSGILRRMTVLPMLLRRTQLAATRGGAGLLPVAALYGARSVGTIQPRRALRLATPPTP